MTTFAALRAALAEPITWEGDLEDDCSARWRGMVAHAECMGYACDEDCCEDVSRDDRCERGDAEHWYFSVTRIAPDCQGHGRGGQCSCEQLWHTSEEAASTTTGDGARAYAERIMRLAEIERLIG